MSADYLAGDSPAEPLLAEPLLAEPLLEGLLDAESRLQAAQRAGDLVALDRLLDDRLVAVGPLGALVTKADDLEAYRSGTSVVTGLVEEDLQVLVAGSTGVTFVVARVAGTFGGEPFAALLRYTRTWWHDGSTWRVLAAHIAVLPPPGG